MIKYSNWNIQDVSEIYNKDTAVERWNNFLKIASEKVLKTIKLVYISLTHLVKTKYFNYIYEIKIHNRFNK